MRILLRLAMLLSVMLMPFGMSPAAAAPATQDHAAMPMPHCPDQAPSQDTKGIGGCVMACSAALPAMELVTPMPSAAMHAPVTRPVIAALTGLQPEIATPPPRSS